MRYRIWRNEQLAIFVFSLPIISILEKYLFPKESANTRCCRNSLARADIACLDCKNGQATQCYTAKGRENNFGPLIIELIN